MRHDELTIRPGRSRSGANLSGGRDRRRGFTFIELLATIVLIAVIMPVAMRSIGLCTRLAGQSRRQMEAASLAKAKLTELIVTNYTLQDKEMAVLVDLGVHYSSDLVKVERVTREVAAEVMREVPGGVPGFVPFIRYNTFGDSSIGFTTILRAQSFVDQYLVKHEFIMRVHARYAREGIVIPYPIRAINTDQEKRGEG
jgi:prepilin-type N-terminal cleavage/methylation domain-containing protein